MPRGSWGARKEGVQVHDSFSIDLFLRDQTVKSLLHKDEYKLERSSGEGRTATPWRSRHGGVARRPRVLVHRRSGEQSGDRWSRVQHERAAWERGQVSQRSFRGGAACAGEAG